MTETKATSATITLDDGCYIDSHHGIYSIERLYELVDELVRDWETKDDDRAIISHSLHGDFGAKITLDNGHEASVTDCGDFVGTLYDELTERLPKAGGFCWHWEDGELFYGAIDEMEELYG